MKFLVDESTGAKVARYLSSDHDVKYVGEIKPGADDSDVLQMASQDQRILITNDKDFGELVFKRREPHSGVIFLRLKDDNPQTRITVLGKVISAFEGKLENSFTTATEKKVRIRKSR